MNKTLHNSHFYISVQQDWGLHPTNYEPVRIQLFSDVPEENFPKSTWEEIKQYVDDYHMML